MRFFSPGQFVTAAHIFFSYNAFICGEILQRSQTGFLCFFLLAAAKQRQVTLQSFGVNQPTCSVRVWILNHGVVKVALVKKKKGEIVLKMQPLRHLVYRN